MKIDRDLGILYLSRRMEEIEDGCNETLSLLDKGEGSRSGCALVLSGYFETLAEHHYWIEHDLAQAKQYAYLSAKTEIIKFQSKGYGSLDRVDRMNMVLMSDNPELIHWYSQFVYALYSTHNKWINRNRVGAYQYLDFQRHLALQGKFELLGERAEYILANPPGKAMQRYQVDHEFYLGLARGDTAKMAEAIRFLCSKKGARNRNFADSNSCAAHFMSPMSLQLGKLAALAGYELDIDEPLYPQELVKVAPLAHYDDTYSCLKDLDIYSKFSHPEFSDVGDFTPLPPGQYNVDLTIQSNPGEKLP